MTNIIIALIYFILVCIVVLILTKLSSANSKIEYLEQYIKIVESYAKESLLEQAKTLDQLTKKINSKFKLN